MPNLANGRAKGSSSLYSTFTLNYTYFYELNKRPRNPTNKFTLKIVYLV